MSMFVIILSLLAFLLNKFDLNMDVHESPISGGSYVIYFSKLNIPIILIEVGT